MIWHLLLADDPQSEFYEGQEQVAKINCCCNRECASFSKFVSASKRAALFLAIRVGIPWLLIGGYKTWRYGLLNANEYEDLWRNMLMYGLLFDLASKAEGGCSLLYEKRNTV